MKCDTCIHATWSDGEIIDCRCEPIFDPGVPSTHECCNGKYESIMNIGSVCRDCATKAGFAPKDKVVDVCMGECEICHERKPCTDMWHDWNPPNVRGGAK